MKWLYGIRSGKLGLALWCLLVARLFVVLANVTTYLHTKHYFPLDPIRTLNSTNHQLRTDCLTCALGINETWKPIPRTGWITLHDISHIFLTNVTDQWPIQTLAMYLADVQV